MVLTDPLSRSYRAITLHGRTFTPLFIFHPHFFFSPYPRRQVQTFYTNLFTKEFVWTCEVPFCRCRKLCVLCVLSPFIRASGIQCLQHPADGQHAWSAIQNSAGLNSCSAFNIRHPVYRVCLRLVLCHPANSPHAPHTALKWRRGR